MLRRKVLCLLFLALVALPALAAEKEKPLPKDLPPYGELKPFTAPQVTVRKLGNGLTLWLVPRPGFPKVALALAVQGGMVADPADRPGLADFLTETVDQGTASRTARQIAEELQAVGGDLEATARADSLALTVSVLSSGLGSGLSVLADVAQHASFPESEVELARRNLADSLRAQEAQPRFQAARALARLAFGPHPYSIIAPTQESIAATTVAELRREFARRFRSDGAVLVAVGDFDVDKIAALAETHFGKWRAPASAPVSAVTEPAAGRYRAVFAVAREGSVQTTISLGALAPRRSNAEYAAARVANAIYGGTFTSRLVSNIREEKGYTYSPGSSIQARTAAGLLRTIADVRNQVTGAALNEIGYELNRMATTAPTAEELLRAQRYLVGSAAISLQSRGAVARELALIWVDGLPPGHIGSENAAIQQVTAEDVSAAGRKYFPLSRMAIVAVGDEKVIGSELEPLGLEIQPAP